MEVHFLNHPFYWNILVHWPDYQKLTILYHHASILDWSCQTEILTKRPGNVAKSRVKHAECHSIPNRTVPLISDGSLRYLKMRTHIMQMETEPMHNQTNLGYNGPEDLKETYELHPISQSTFPQKLYPNGFRHTYTHRTREMEDYHPSHH